MRIVLFLLGIVIAASVAIFFYRTDPGTAGKPLEIAGAGAEGVVRVWEGR
jgi:hypothetical protein